MQFNKIFKKKYFNALTSFVLALICSLIFLIIDQGFLEKVDNIFNDSLQGEVSARKEIVIVGIDDASLNEIGAWPWDRTVFAQTLNNISEDKPSVVGIDVLFLEQRTGDSEFEKSIASMNDSGIPIVLGSKFVDNPSLKGQEQLYKSIYPSAQSGFVNFDQDTDGKIRKTTTSIDCEPSFALNITTNYFDINTNEQKKLCGDTIQLRSNTYKTSKNHELIFSYTKEDFTYISFKDVQQGKYEKGLFKDKVVLIGSTALDLRSNLNDNFTNVFGDNTAGIYIHANIINSYLNNTFYQYPSKYLVAIILFSINFFLINAYFRLKKIAYTALVILGALLLNFLLSILIVNLNFLTFFVQTSIVAFLAYIVVLIIKYTLQNKETRFIKHTFSRYLNKHLLDILLQDTSKLDLGGETKNMSVLFSDIRGFTSLSEKMQPHELVTMLNNYLNFMSNIILKNSGTIDKYIGDAIMALWNAPLDDSRHAVHAVKSGLLMGQGLKQFQQSYPNYPEIKIGIGINTGQMTVGNVGGKDRFDYTVLGDNVNLASRLEGLTKKYGVPFIVSESTYKNFLEQNKVNNNTSSIKIIFRLLDEVIVKGRSQSIKIYEPLVKSAQNEQIKRVYEHAFAIYQKGDFSQAKKILGTNSNKGDNALEVLLKRIEIFEKKKLEKWDGVWEWEEK